MDRRDFIKTSCLACAGTIGAAWVLQACSSAKHLNNVVIKDNRITVKKSEFTVAKKDKTVEQKFILLKSEGMEFPIALYKLMINGTEEYKALYLQCTHQGCEVTPYEAAVVCPCHGAEFNTKGMVIQGPAERDLKTFSTIHDDENIYVQL